MTTLLQLMYEFFKTGLFAVGGGLATLPFLYEISSSTGWYTPQDISNMIAISESTPGPMGVNMSTYVGFTTAGIPGAIAASLSLAAPAIIIIILVSKFLKRFKDSVLVQKIFYGLRPASTALIAAAGLGVAQISLLNISAFQDDFPILSLFQWKSILLAIIIYIALKKFKLHPVVYIAASAVIGVIFQF